MEEEEEEQQKRNTDCVYFLASPLTCRKGGECEYRHSETARLNPRDCWYWLSGNCLSPSCAFRHPPLEKQAESASESDTIQPQASVPTNKTNVPCYFYLNGFCSKGNKCSFLHGADTFSGKFVRASSAATDGLPSDNKTFMGNKTIPASKKVNATPVAVPKPNVDLNMQYKEDVRETVPERVVRELPPQIAVSHREEAAVTNSPTVLQAVDLSGSKSYSSSYQYLDEPVDNHVEPEERRESSPGFDVLVDDKSEYMVYDDDEEYRLALEGDDRELNGQYLRDDFVDPTEYDPAHPDAEHFYEGEMVDSYDCVDNGHIFDDVGKDSGCSQDRMLDSVLSQKRKVLLAETDINDRGGVDLRDHLRKRRISNGRVGRSSTSSGSSHLLRHSGERPQRRGISQRLHKRLVLEARILGGPHGDNGTFSNGGYQHGWINNTQLERSRLHYYDRKPAARQLLPSDEVSRKSGPRDKTHPKEHVSFSGPKSLAQIKEEKKKAEENGDCNGITGQSIASVDFEGPKPLSEILKEKRRLSSVAAASES